MNHLSSSYRCHYPTIIYKLYNKYFGYSEQGRKKLTVPAEAEDKADNAGYEATYSVMQYGAGYIKTLCHHSWLMAEGFCRERLQATFYYPSRWEISFS
jgi:hypothetical protein